MIMTKTQRIALESSRVSETKKLARAEPFVAAVLETFPGATITAQQTPVKDHQ